VVVAALVTVAAGLVVVGMVSGAGPFGCDPPPGTDTRVRTSPDPIAEFIVKFHDDAATADEKQAVLDDAGDQVDATVVQRAELGIGATLVQLGAPLDVDEQEEFLQALVDSCEVEFAEPDLVMETQ
jgi:hypothetical protein